jgi:murein DD-endopeptidase MepM/ murein hydrolase activator NlpD
MTKIKVCRYIYIFVGLLFVYVSQAEAGSFVNPTAPGYRYYSQEFKGKVHEGVDITGESKGLIEDKSAFAAKDGKVIYADWEAYQYEKDKNGKPKLDRDGNPIPVLDENGNRIPDQEKGYGKVVIIDHEDGTLTVYGHLNDFNVKVGDRVSTLDGDVVGTIDNTGKSFGHHLHFEIR